MTACSLLIMKVIMFLILEFLLPQFNVNLLIFFLSHLLYFCEINGFAKFKWHRYYHCISAYSVNFYSTMSQEVEVSCGFFCLV